MGGIVVRIHPFSSSCDGVRREVGHILPSPGRVLRRTIRHATLNDADDDLEFEVIEPTRQWAAVRRYLNLLGQRKREDLQRSKEIRD